MKVITVRNTPPYGNAPTYQISLTYLERQMFWAGQEYYLKNNYLTFRSMVKVPRLTKVITVRDTPPYSHAPTYQI
jgi:hypothetical protein